VVRVPHILVIDDEAAMRESLSLWLKEEGYYVEAVASGPEAIEKVGKKTWNIALLDLKMPGMDGLEVQREIKKISPETQIVMITAYPSVDTAISAMKEGAYDYIIKPFDPDEVSFMVKKIIEHQDLLLENILLRQRLEEKYQFPDIIGKSDAMQNIFELIRKVAPTIAPVLITGETGTGKELVARAIHGNSTRCHRPFVAVSCGALPETLLESELFGYEKGAFTGAEVTKKGRFEMADGGTLFLDEIGEISPRTQVDLLRVLEEKKLMRLGGTKSIEVDIRIISATNRDLKKAVEDGIFRNDLYYRLNVVSIHLPPLRERKDDIPLLVEEFLRRYNVEMNKRMDSLSPKALAMLMDYDWPGNIRELQNVIERAVVVGRGPRVLPEDLPFIIPGLKKGYPKSLKELEKFHVKVLLEENQWNIRKTAIDLGVDRQTLYNKIRKYDLKREEQRGKK